MTRKAERFVVFECAGDRCIGVLNEANGAAALNVGVIIVVGGPQYRVGSHRQFRLLADSLAGAGISSLRFDYRGMGDSEGESRSFDSIGQDLEASVDTFVAETGLPRVVLWGLCDGASAALLYASEDSRVAGVIAVNPWAHARQTRAYTLLKHYYGPRLFSQVFWRKVLSGRLNLWDSKKAFVNAVREGVSDEAVPDNTAYLARIQASWEKLARPVFFVVSENDFTAREFEEWIRQDRKRRRLYSSELSATSSVAGADHTFSTREWRDALAAKTIEWIKSRVEFQSCRVRDSKTSEPLLSQIK